MVYKRRSRFDAGGPRSGKEINAGAYIREYTGRVSLQSYIIIIAVSIIRHPQPWGATKNEVVTFTILTAGERNLIFEWQLNGKKITESDKIFQEDDPGDDETKSTLQLTFSPEKHKGTYQCLVKDGRRRGLLASSNCVELKGKYIIVLSICII